jgi:GAF domain-containing protein
VGTEEFATPESGAPPDSEARQSIEAALEIAREALGMEAGYVAQFANGEQVYRATAGESESFEIRQDEGYPLDGSYCKRMVMGAIPNTVTDSAANEQTRDLAITKLGEIGAYIGVPITFSDGSVYGTVCAVSHEAHEELSNRDVLVLKAVAKLMASELERESLRGENDKLRAQLSEAESEIEDLREAVQAAEASGAGTESFVDARGWRPD